jgi:3',5'-cyclic AMP phosphodiesterase CpdA
VRTIAHLSDLHFGAADPVVVEALLTAVAAIAPDLVVVSGDLTQRARRRQFLRARAFLDALPQPQLVVPGNHDVPFFNVWSRFVSPRAGFRRYITADRHPAYVDDEVAVFGADTTRSFTIQDGGLRPSDVAVLTQQLAAAAEGVTRIVVCHHPFDLPAGPRARMTMPRPAADAVSRLVSHGADMFLTGHLHVSYVGGTATRYDVDGRSAIVVEAGTATSVRGRGETNSFNVVRCDRARIAIERMSWDPQTGVFVRAEHDWFERSATGWVRSTRE